MPALTKVKAALGSAAFALCALVATACTYAPDFASGTLQCSAPPNAGKCPQGYSCQSASNTCWKDGPSVANFPGHWLFQPGSQQTINCLDGSKDTKDLFAEDDFVDFEEGGATELRASYYCDWDLTLDASLTKTAIVPAQTCQTTGTDGTKFTWLGTSFVFTTSNGKTGTLQADIKTDYVPPAPALPGTCALKISGTLARAP
jgi:hypothetical protein